MRDKRSRTMHRQQVQMPLPQVAGARAIEAAHEI
jgi:hypothetical protein